MNKLKRYSIQVILWLVIGIIVWLNQKSNLYVLKKNSIVFIFQIILIGSLIYYTAPKLLLQRKYWVFAIFSVAVLSVSAYVLSTLSPLILGNPIPVRMPRFRPPPHLMTRKPPSLLLWHALMLTVSYALSALVELFIYVNRKEREAIEIQNINLRNELKLLKSQINPHFLFNTLNNIYALSTIDSNKTQKSISYLSDMLRYVLYECENDRVPIKKEIKYIENYLKLFALKNSKAYPVTTEFNIENNNINIAPMLFIPFLENALKHGNIEKIKGAFITIKIEAKKDIINFEVENSLPKTDTNKDDIGGIGLENVKKRLAILYPNKHNLFISENESSFKVQLNLKSL